MQLLDFLFGAAGRGPEHCCLRFNPPYSTQADAAPKAPQVPDLQQAAPNANAEGPAPISIFNSSCT
ncbi:MAG: hypothetical protein IKI02_06655 [Oscillospiraceae bacterium]|nr:hypothetical protein [Oscillospiraceae bacterium]